MGRISRSVWCGLVGVAAVSGWAVAGSLSESEPIRYLSAAATDPVAKLQARIDGGKVKLAHDRDRGYLKSVLGALDISPTSQTLVFSKTSFQHAKIGPQTPRAIYFNDDVYVGWVPRGDVIEVASVDPMLGSVYYLLDQAPADRPAFARETHQCLQCHESSRTEDVPGLLVRSVFPGRSGAPVFSAGTFVTSHESPLKERWGGWYVTGTHGRQRHMGNVVLKGENTDNLDREAGANVTDLNRLVDTTPYLTPHSDIVALMVLEHQTQRPTSSPAPTTKARIALHQEAEINKALGRPAAEVSESTRHRIESYAEKLVRALLFVDEAKLTGPIAGTSGFAAVFARRGPTRLEGAIAPRLRPEDADVQVSVQLSRVFGRVRRPARRVEAPRRPSASRGPHGPGYLLRVRPPRARRPPGGPRNPRARPSPTSSGSEGGGPDRAAPEAFGTALRPAAGCAMLRGTPTARARDSGRPSMRLPGLLDRERTVAPPGFNRWLIPPAALAVHLCIGEIYGFSVFNVPLTRVIGIDKSIAGKDWTIPQVGWIYSIALIMLGLSAAVFGRWVERVGPRKTMLASACAFCGGLVISSLGVATHRLWLLYLGYGVVGGIGLGLGYIAPVSTLVKWFPDRPGMATGLAIMGFGGGALVGAPLGVELMNAFKSSTSVGVAEAFLVMAGVYFAFMTFGAFLVRVPAPGWVPKGYSPNTESRPNITRNDVLLDVAWKTPQFWLLWTVLCLNVTAGIGILGQASPMCQDMFGVSAAVGGGFAGLLSLFNMGGRFFWSSTSDHTGRKAIYCVYFLLGAVLYLLVPVAQRLQSVSMFVLVTAAIISMYGGGFATIPAYLRDLFGTKQLGAIHGRLITAWSMAAVLGPQLVTYMSDARIKRGIPRAEAYNPTMYLMSTLLLLGLVCNLLVRPVAPHHHDPTEARP